MVCFLLYLGLFFGDCTCTLLLGLFLCILFVIVIIVSSFFMLFDYYFFVSDFACGVFVWV